MTMVFDKLVTDRYRNPEEQAKHEMMTNAIQNRMEHMFPDMPTAEMPEMSTSMGNMKNS